MQLSSCRELKRKLLAQAYEAPGLGRSLRSYSVLRAAAARSVRTTEVTPVAAVGVAPWKRRDYKLAVRVFFGQDRNAAAFVRGLARYGAEVDLVRGVRYKPRITIQPGGSCGHYKITAGTLGGFVEDDEHHYILSNNHVLANSNFCFGDDPILQPGPADITSRGGFASSGNSTGGTR